MTKNTACNRCNSRSNIEYVSINDTSTAFCEKCRTLLFQEKKSVGRPSIGKTKKISLTLPEEDWLKLDSLANGNRSQFIRKTIVKALIDEEKK